MALKNKAVSRKTSKSEYFELLEKMILIRLFEDRCSEHYSRGNIKGFLHLYTGEEAIAVGAISCLEKEDYVITHYRDHGHALARGIEAKYAMAELFGKSTGTTGGILVQVDYVAMQNVPKGRHFYDLELTNKDKTPEEVTRILKGVFEVDAEVTR